MNLEYNFKRALLKFPQPIFSLFRLDLEQIWKNVPCYSVTDKEVF